MSSNGRTLVTVPLRISKTWRALACAGVALAFGVFAYHYGRFGYRQCHPARTLVSSEERAAATSALADLADVSFQTKDGVTLRGWYEPPKNGVVVVLVHGLGGNRASLLPDAEVMARHGYGILLYDSRAHGESGGDTATWGSTEANDIAQAVGFVRSHPDAQRIALLGFSVGASAVTRAAANDPSISAVILYATWPSLRAEMAYKAQRGGWLAAQLTLLAMSLSGTRIDEIRPEQDMKRIAPRPVLMLSGGEDLDTPPWAMDSLFSDISGPKQFWREPEVGHGGYEQAEPSEYERRVVGFLDHTFF